MALRAEALTEQGFQPCLLRGRSKLKMKSLKHLIYKVLRLV